MKKIVALLLVSCFAIFNIGCGKSASNNNWTCPNCGTINGGNYCSNCGLAKPSDDFENSRATNEKDDSASTESDNENDSDWLNSAYEDRNAYEIFSGYTLNNADTKNIVAKLNNNENSFVRFLYDEYEALDYENMTDLERDFFDNYWRCYFSFSFK